MRRVCWIVTLLLIAPVAADDDAAHRRALADWVKTQRGAIVEELRGFLALPNVSSDHAGLRLNAEHLVKMLKRRGLETRLLETSTAPYVFAELRPEADHPDGEPPVVLFYGHFDGQVVDASRWTATDPFVPMLTGPIDDPDTRIYARSASDDKSPIVALLAAIDGLRAVGVPPNIHAKFIFDPEEEIGSPQVVEVVTRHAELLAADLFVFADGPVHQSGRPTVVFGARGIVTVTLTTHGANRPLHSGHYGNWAPNPAQQLAGLLASMKDDAGNVRIAGFYDDVTPLSPRERRALAAIPSVEPMLQDELAIAQPEGDGASLVERINLPSLNIRGMASAWVGGQARTIVPSTATAEIDIRLVKAVRPEAQVARLKAHARSQGFHVIEDEPSDELRRSTPRLLRVTARAGTPAVRTPMDLGTSQALIAAVARAVEGEPVLMPTLGGTVPLHQFESALGIPIYGVPIVNFDNNQHSPDENLRLGNLWDGIVIYASLLRMPSPDGFP